MFSKNNPRYFEHNPHIKLTLTNGTIHLRPIGYNTRTFNIKSFEFVNCESLRVTDKIMTWFIEDVLTGFLADDFMFQLSMSTAPADLQHRLTQFQGTN